MWFLACLFAAPSVRCLGLYSWQPMELKSAPRTEVSSTSALLGSQMSYTVEELYVLTAGSQLAMLAFFGSCSFLDHLYIAKITQNICFLETDRQ